MSPAFSSTRQAGAFAVLLLLLLLLPVMVGKSLLPTREQMYAQTGRSIIDFPYLHQQIYEEKGDIDIAIMSSSRLGCALKAPYLEDKLSERLGRKAVVRSLTWTWNGYDALYFIAQDLLQNRKVHMIVFCDLSFGAGEVAHRQTSYWFRYADNADALAGLSLEAKASFYASAVLGIPRNLAGLLRPNLSAISAELKPWNLSPTHYIPENDISASNVLTYSDSTKASFHFSETPITPMQRAFVRRLGALAAEHQTQLVILHLPDFADRHETTINEEMFWPEAFGVNLPMIGIPPAVLFSGITDDDAHKLYYNFAHFNQNGQNYFNSIMAPALIQTYEDQIKR